MSRPQNANALLAERAKLVARVAEIERALEEQHGIKMAARVCRSRPQRAAILAALADGPKDTAALAHITGQGVHAIQQMAHLLVKEGAAVRIARGIYGLPPQKEKATR